MKTQHTQPPPGPSLARKQQLQPPQDKAPGSGGIPGADFVDAGSKKRGKKGGSGGSTGKPGKPPKVLEAPQQQQGDANGGGEFNTTNWWTTVEAALADDSAYEPRGWNTLVKPAWGSAAAGGPTSPRGSSHESGHSTGGHSGVHAPGQGAAANGHHTTYSSDPFPVALPPDPRGLEEALEGGNMDPDAMVAQLMDMGYSIEDAQVAFQCRTLAACVDAIATKTDPDVLATFRAQELAAQQLQQWRQRVNSASAEGGSPGEQHSNQLFSGGSGGGGDSDEWKQVGGGHGKQRSKAALAAQLAPGTAAVLKRLLESGLITESQLDVGTVRKLVNAPPKVAFDVVVGLEKCLALKGKMVRNIASWLDVGLLRVASFHAEKNGGHGSDAGTSDGGGRGGQAPVNAGAFSHLPRHFRGLHPDIVVELLLALQAMRCTPEELDELATRELEVWQRCKGVEFTVLFLEDMKHHSTRNTITNAGAWMFGCMRRFDAAKQQSAMETRRRAETQQAKQQQQQQQQQQRQASPTRSYASNDEQFGSYYAREPSECSDVQQQQQYTAYPEWAGHVNENQAPAYGDAYYGGQHHQAAPGADAVGYSTAATLAARPPGWSMHTTPDVYAAVDTHAPHMLHASFTGMAPAHAMRPPPGFGRVPPEAPPSVAAQAFSSGAPFSLFTSAAAPPPMQPGRAPGPKGDDDDMQFILSQLTM